MLALIALCLFLSREITSASTGTRQAQYLSTHSFRMGKAHVTYCKALNGHGGTHALQKRALEGGPGPQVPYGQPNHGSHLLDSTAPPPLKTIDLTPARSSYSTCYPGTFQPPLLDDCEVVINAQLNNSTGSLEAPPGSWVFVSYGTCAAVFQNPEESSYTLQYNWAELGDRARKIAGNCLQDDDISTGGVCVFERHLEYEFEGVMITLQRFDDRGFKLDN